MSGAAASFLASLAILLAGREEPTRSADYTEIMEVHSPGCFVLSLRPSMTSTLFSCRLGPAQSNYTVSDLGTGPTVSAASWIAEVEAEGVTPGFL